MFVIQKAMINIRLRIKIHKENFVLEFIEILISNCLAKSIIEEIQKVSEIKVELILSFIKNVFCIENSNKGIYNWIIDRSLNSSNPQNLIYQDIFKFWVTNNIILAKINLNISG